MASADVMAITKWSISVQKKAALQSWELRAPDRVPPDFEFLVVPGAPPGARPCSVGDSATLVRDRRLGVRRVSRVLLDAADKVERGVECLVVLRIRRDIGLRPGLLVAFGLEMAAQRSLAARGAPRFSSALRCSARGRLELLVALLEMLLRAPRVTTPPPRMPRSVPAAATGVFFFGAGCFNI
jgi:hypothetical protein